MTASQNLEFLTSSHEKGAVQLDVRLNFLDLQTEPLDAARNPVEKSKSANNENPELPGVSLTETAKGKESENNNLENAGESQAEELRAYPELALLTEAEQVLADKSLDSKTSWEKASTLFHLAELQLENQIDLLGGAQAMRKKTELFAVDIVRAIENFKKNERGFQTADYPNKATDERQLRELIKDLPASEVISSMLAERDLKLSEQLLKALDDDEKEMLAEMKYMSNKLQILPAIKIKHALAANNQFAKTGDVSDKIFAENILKSYAATDPAGYQSSPEIKGLLIQSQRGESMDLSDGKATALAFTEEAKRVILMALAGVDAIFNGEQRQAAALQSIKLLAAGLAANFELANKHWHDWPNSKSYPIIFQRAKEMVQPEPPRSSSPNAR